MSLKAVLLQKIFGIKLLLKLLQSQRSGRAVHKAPTVLEVEVVIVTEDEVDVVCVAEVVVRELVVTVVEVENLSSTFWAKDTRFPSKH